MSRSDVSRLLGSDHILHWNRITCDMQQSMDISIKHFATKMISKSCRMLVAKVTGGPQFSPFRSMQHKVAMSPRANLGFTEIEIKVPWGTLAGKLWNPNDTTPIIALHGWQDNAGSFDKLVPLLPEDISVLAIDLPGHGLSSWIPDGMMYTKLMYIQIIDRIRDHFRWERIGLLGHSYGAMFAFTYSGLFPNSVKFVIAIDYYKYLVENIGVRTARTARDFRDFIKIEKTKRPPFGYTEREMIEKMIKGSDDSLDESSCRVMMERGVTMKNNVCYLNRDPRVKLRDLSATFTEDLLREKARLVRCPYMVLKAEKTGYGEQKSSYFEILKAMEKSCEDLQFLTVPGKHHIHMTNAKRVAEVITPFIEKYN